MSTTWTYQVKEGEAWQYNQLGLAYNATQDNLGSGIVYYNSIGLPTTWTLQAKS